MLNFHEWYFGNKLPQWHFLLHFYTLFKMLSTGTPRLLRFWLVQFSIRAVNIVLDAP